MKKTSKVLVIVIGIFLWGCYSGDDNGSRYVHLSIEDALTIENQENYVVGDTIFFELNFSRYLREEGYANLLDIFESTDATGFEYSFDLTKSSDFSNNYVPVAIDPSFIFAEKGEVYDFNNGATATLNEAQDLYESRVGIILAEAGNFRFDFDFLYLSSQYAPNKISLEIRHQFSANSTVNFDFTVTE